MATIPTKKELAFLIAEAHPVLAVALAAVTDDPVRGGPPCPLHPHGRRYWTVSKGKQVAPIGYGKLTARGLRGLLLALNQGSPYATL